jgi:hypothetical protein
MKKVFDRLVDQHSELAEKMNYSYYWEVDGRKLTNINLVRWYEQEYRTWANFVCRPDLMQRFHEVLQDKTLDMSHNYNLDMIKKIKKDHDHVSLLFSGGYDSSLVFFEFVKNNIHIDETIMALNCPTDGRQNEEFLMCGGAALEDWKHMVGQQTTVQCTENDLMRQYADGYAFFSSPMDACPAPYYIGMYSPEHYFKGASLQDWGDSELVHQKAFKQNSCHIKAIQKPQLIYYKHKWYVTALDSGFGCRNGLLNKIYFWLHPDNAKGLIKYARLYRDFCLRHEYGMSGLEEYTATELSSRSEMFDTKSTLTFAYLQDHYEFNKIIGRGNIYNEDKKMPKRESDFGARFEFIKKDRWDVQCAYSKNMSKFLEVFPYCGDGKGMREYNNQGKFAWFIDIDSLEIFTQQELIPNGFEDIVNTMRVQSMSKDELDQYMSLSRDRR